VALSEVVGSVEGLMEVEGGSMVVVLVVASVGTTALSSGCSGSVWEDEREEGDLPIRFTSACEPRLARVWGVREDTLVTVAF